MGLSAHLSVFIECDDCLHDETADNVEIDPTHADVHIRRRVLSEARSRGWEVWQECPPDGRVTRCVCPACQIVIWNPEEEDA